MLVCQPGNARMAFVVFFFICFAGLYPFRLLRLHFMFFRRWWVLDLERKLSETGAYLGQTE